MMKKLMYLLILIGLAFFVGCSKIQRITDVVTNPSAREIYSRNFDKDDVTYLKWQNELELARTNKLKVGLPALINGRFEVETTPPTLGYSVKLERGEELWVTINTAIDSSLVFVDVYPFLNDSIVGEKPIISTEWNSKQLNLPIESSGTYKIVIQPGLRNSGSFFYKIFTQPTLRFPVADKSNEAIQSFWGAARDGGTRIHKGLDIFASRGTPVVAVTDGYVSFTGERGLGGKQVWLRNGIFGHSLYYAHLDSIAISTGKRLKLGDTLGFVGNTGNAKTTAPHLHFGIYTREGAVNPLPYIKKQPIPKSVTVDMGTTGFTRQKQNQLRLGPEVSYEKVATLPSKDTLMILVKVDDWYHVKTDANLEGFMHRSLISIQ